MGCCGGGCGGGFIPPVWNEMTDDAPLVEEDIRLMRFKESLFDTLYDLEQDLYKLEIVSDDVNAAVDTASATETTLKACAEVHRVRVKEAVLRLEKLFQVIREEE